MDSEHRILRHGRALSALTAALLGLILLMLMFGESTAGGPIVVTNADDPGTGNCDAQCTLREALDVANGTAGHDTITFDPAAFPPDNPSTISVASELPASTDPAGVTIDGTGAGVIIDGSLLPGAGRGLTFNSSSGVDLQDVTIRNLTVQDFPGDGVFICGGAALVCGDDVRNTLIEGVRANGNGDEGIEVFGDTTDDTLLIDCETNGNTENGITVNGTNGNSASRVEGCTTSDNGSRGVNLTSNLGNTVDAQVSLSVANGNSDRGINLNAGDDTVNAIVEDTTAIGNMSTGININAGKHTIDPTVTGSTATGNMDGIVLNGGEPSSGATVSGNSSSANSGDGLATDTSGTYSENELENNGGDGFSARELGITIQDSTLSGNGEHAIDGNNGGGMTIRRNVISGNMSTASALRVPGSNNVITDNEITDHPGDGIDNGFTSSGSTTITGNVIMDSGGDGIAAGPDGNHLITNNLVVRSGSDGIRALGPSSIVEGNTVLASLADGIQVSSADAEVHFNRIVGNAVGLTYPDSPAINAENNWWGCNEGPNAPGCDTSESEIDADPWLVLSLAVLSDTVDENDSVAVFGTVTMNSDGQNTFGQGSILDGTELLFETDLGSVGSTSVTLPTDDGAAEAQYTADGGPGVANLSVSLDNATVTVPVTVAPAATATPAASPTATAAPTETPVATATATPATSPTPTGTPAKGLFGDMDCDGDVDAVDALAILRFVAGLPPLNQQEPCPEVGSAGGGAFGDLDCDGDVDAVDALAILRFVANLSPLAQVEPCPDIGPP